MKLQKPIQLCDTSYFAKWEDLTSKPASTITHNDTDTEILDGLVVYGYETKFGKTNENGERYEKGAMDKFVQTYFVDNKLNMPVDIEHNGMPDWLCGRVIYAESNDTGFYFVCYIPRVHPKFDYIKMLIEQGLLQGLSKWGWATDGEWVYDKNEPLGGYFKVSEVQIVRMSLVSTPANAVKFERVKEIKNALHFVANHSKETNTPRIFRKK